MSKTAWLCVALASSALAFADNPLNLQVGLWEVKPLKTVIDGVDNSAKMAQAMASMQAQMANMPPDQRAKMEAMMQQHGVTINQNGLTGQVCLNQDMVKRNAFPVGKDSNCQPTWTQAGNTTNFAYSCSNNGVTRSGKGTAQRSGNSVSIVTDGTTTSAGGNHTEHMELQMNYLGADCGAIKPVGSSQ
ncbi:MAG: DUF3617 domain-containing protein [Steroidobacteraceae bacterium]|jgi:hypothetical protein